ncbi:MAG: HEAT repeat domain-containing protein [Planctomycetota bacterium]|jgi:HEAT repeat protein
MSDTNRIKNRIAVALLCAVLISSASARSFTAEEITNTLRQFRTYDYPADPTPTETIENIVRFVGDKPELRAVVEKQMLALLESDATIRAKQFICHQLWIIATDNSVPTLQKMLLDKATAEMACYALRTNPSDVASRTMREALSRTDERTKITIINILGDRKDTAAVDLLIPLLESDNTEIARAAAISLGTIAAPDAVQVIAKARETASGKAHATLTRAWLRCAEHYTRDNRIADALAIYKKLFDKSEAPPVRRAALASAMNTGHADTAELMIAAIDGDDPTLRAAAIANSPLLKGPEITKTLISALKTAQTDTKVLLIEALGRRDDPLVKDAVTAQATGKETDVRIAAYNALADVGDASSAKLLCNALSKSPTDPEIDTILAALRRMSAKGTDHAIVETLSSADGPTKARLIKVISDRRYTPAVPTLRDCARREDPAVAKAALRAIGSLAGCQGMGSLISLMLDQSDPAIRSEAAAAIIAITHRGNYEKFTAELILNRIKETDSTADRCTLIRILSATPGDEPLQYLQSASKDPAAEIRDCAVRTLADYPQASAAPILLDIFETSRNRTHRTLALRGCIRLCKTTETPPEAAVKLYRQAMQRAATAAEKKLILSGLGELTHSSTLQIALDTMQDREVKAEASLAVLNLAQKLIDIDPITASQAAAAILKDPALANLHPRARKIIEADPFANIEPIALFDGKTFNGWEGNFEIFSIENGAVVGGSLEAPVPRNEYLCSKKDYADFELRLKVKLLGAPESANAGIQIRSRRVPGSNEMVGYQADMGQHYWGGLYCERRHKLLVAPDRPELGKVLKLNDWNDYRILCLGKRIQLWINGHQTVNYVEQDDSIEQTGVVGLQIHSGPPARSFYKGIMIRVIK